jgi:hypothetical protein
MLKRLEKNIGLNTINGIHDSHENVRSKALRALQARSQWRARAPSIAALSIVFKSMVDSAWQVPVLSFDHAEDAFYGLKFWRVWWQK